MVAQRFHIGHGFIGGFPERRLETLIAALQRRGDALGAMNVDVPSGDAVVTEPGGERLAAFGIEPVDESLELVELGRSGQPEQRRSLAAPPAGRFARPQVIAAVRPGVVGLGLTGVLDGHHAQHAPLYGV